MTEKQLFSLKVVVWCTILIIVLVGISAAKALLDKWMASDYDTAIERTTIQRGEVTPDADNHAFNLFLFNTDQIDTGNLHPFSESLAKEYVDHDSATLDKFLHPIEFYMEYQGKDWNGKVDDNHSLVFEDGSTVKVSIHNNALHIYYYDGWEIRGKNTYLSNNLRELWILSNGTRLWRNDGRIHAFDFIDDSVGATWIFSGNHAYLTSESKEPQVSELPFSYDQMTRWATVPNTGMLCFTIQHDDTTELWQFFGGNSTLIYSTPGYVDIIADNFGSNEPFLRYVLPEQVVIVSSDGSITRN